MQKAVQRIFLLFTKTNPPRKRNVHKSRGQSLVEVAIAFPILIMLFAGVVEFGFIINNYLSLLDATRDAARLWSNGDPFVPIGNPPIADGFYKETAYEVQRILDPVLDKPSYRGRRILLDPALDDVIVTVYAAEDAHVWPCRSPYHLFPTPGSVSGNYPSMFDRTAILNTRISGAPEEGLLLVEIHYNYHQVLALPWLTPFVPDPVQLRAYTIMPIRSAEPPIDAPNCPGP